MKQKIKKLLKNYKVSIPLGLAILLIATMVIANGNNEPTQNFVVASRMTVSQEVEVTGRVVPADDVDLSIEAGGKVVAIPVKVGQKVAAGQTLLRVDSNSLQIRLGRQRAALEKARIALAKEEPKTTSEDDLEKAYEDGFNAVADAFLDLPSLITGLDNVLGQDYLARNSIRNVDGRRALDTRDDVERAFYAADSKYQDVLKQYRVASRESDKAAIESLIVDTYEATKLIADVIKKTNNFVDYMEDQLENSIPAELATDQDDLDTYTDETNIHLATLLEVKDVIKDAQIGITDENLDLFGLKMDVRQAELDIQDTLNQIAERSIRSPISGVVTHIEAEVGETISASNPVVSVISSGQYQIEANLPEADVVKVKVGAPADVTLDAYGSDQIFKAKVVEVNPAETLIDGVATYKATIQFIGADERIKSGMTAEVSIKGERKENVIAVPQRAVITKDDKKFVQVLKGKEIIEKPVKTGLRGTDGNVEITEGIVEGDKIVVFVEKK